MLEDEEYQRAIVFIGHRKDMDKYRDVIDFIFCEVFTRFRRACQKFYDGNGCQLRDHPEATPQNIEHWQGVMINVLKISLERLNKKRWASWGHVCWEAINAVA